MTIHSAHDTGVKERTPVRDMDPAEYRKYFSKFILPWVHRLLFAGGYAFLTWVMIFTNDWKMTNSRGIRTSDAAWIIGTFAVCGLIVLTIGCIAYHSKEFKKLGMWISDKWSSFTAWAGRKAYLHTQKKISK